MTPMRAIGLMSGTSMDGIDVALIETDGRSLNPASGANGFTGRTWTRDYSEDEKALLARAMRDAEGLEDRHARPGCLADAEALVTRAHAEAVEQALAEWSMRADEIGIVGFHGQTVLHRPAGRITVQIGDGHALAARLGIAVVSDLRADDVAAGGEGAPLVPVFHRALAEAAGIAPPFAILNIGGVANVTFIASGDRLVGFDTGPGNALVDDLMHERGGCACDLDGATARRGHPDEDLLGWLLAHPYFARRPPKSLDRNWFSHRLVGHLSLEDAAATLTAFTARAVARALAWAPERPLRWVVGGGGAHNDEMMRLIGEAVGIRPESADTIGWSTDHLEAQAFAYLAARHLAGLPITFPGTTGVAEPLTGGRLDRPANSL